MPARCVAQNWVRPGRASLHFPGMISVQKMYQRSCLFTGHTRLDESRSFSESSTNTCASHLQSRLPASRTTCCEHPQEDQEVRTKAARCGSC
jgi:hypothetical protein